MSWKRESWSSKLLVFKNIPSVADEATAHYSLQASKEMTLQGKLYGYQSLGRTLISDAQN
jgi:hypothetical protein